MFWIVAIVLFIMWLVGLLVVKVTGMFIHLLLVAAVLAVAYHFFVKRKAI